MEIYNHEKYQPQSIPNILKRKTDDGWSLFTGMEARFKNNEALFGSKKYFVDYLSQFQSDELMIIYIESMTRIVKGSGEDRLKIQYLTNIMGAYEKVTQERLYLA